MRESQRSCIVDLIIQLYNSSLCTYSSLDESCGEEANLEVNMRTFQTVTASWKVDGKSVEITQYAGSKVMGVVALKAEDLASAFENFKKEAEKELANV